MAEQWEAEKERRANEEAREKCQEDVRSKGLLGEIGEKARAREKRRSDTASVDETERRHELPFAEQLDLEKEDLQAEEPRHDVDDLPGQLGVESDLVEKARARQDELAVANTCQANSPEGDAFSDADGKAKSRWKAAIAATMLSSIPAAAKARRRREANTLAKVEELDEAESDRRQEVFMAEQWETEKERRANEDAREKCQEDARSKGLLGEIGEKARAREERRSDTASVDETERRHELLFAEQPDLEKESLKAEEARQDVDDLRVQLRVESELVENARAREEELAVVNTSQAHSPEGDAFSATVGKARGKWKAAIAATMLSSITAAAEGRRKKEAECFPRFRLLRRRGGKKKLTH
eukprot:TRINITY_DN2701_c0_g1_i4.p1 TRINITY_DN2701_c0_g1~~TRINITY_DN2701_c0_g1_i4.p1  ORF type:complete len:356 (-),score=86.30 TRINITY_DN2701_c0_g1_i4:134-1201(-)